MIVVKNPHSVIAALKKRPGDVIEVRIPSRGSDLERANDAESAAWNEVIQLAKNVKIPVKPQAPSAGGGPNKGPKPPGGGRVGGFEAHLKEYNGVSVEEIFRSAKQEGPYGIWLGLDCLQDPHNVGAIFRTAGFLGVRGIIMLQDRAAPLTSAVYDVSSGGVEAVPFAQVANLRQAMDKAKEAGLWALGTSEHAKQSVTKLKLDRNWLIILGNEEKGMRRLVQETCDDLCTIPSQGKVDSLNVSVAAGIVIAHFSLHA